MQPVELKRVRTLYACVGEHETELSFEPNMIISNGEMLKIVNNYSCFDSCFHIFSASQFGARLVGGNP